MINVADASSQKAIWQVLDGLQGQVSADEYGLAIASLIYLRWLDFAESEREANAAIDGVEYEPVLPAKFHWRSWCNIHDRSALELIFSELASALNHFSNSRHIGIASQLRRVAPAVERLSRFPTEILAQLIDWLASQPFETHMDQLLLRDKLDELLRRVRDKWSNEYFTPSAIVELMVALGEPKLGESVYDPCFGSAGFLTRAFDYVKQHKPHDVWSVRSPLSISGVERNPDCFVVGLTRLVLSGVTEPQLELGNSLENEPSNIPTDRGYDLVFANPPWGSKVDWYEVNHYPIPSKDSVSLFIQHSISQLRPGGRAILVVPPGILFRGGREKQLRQLLVEEHTVEAVISMPAGAFMPLTSIPSCILMLRKGGKTKSVRMVDAGLGSTKDGSSSTGKFLSPEKIIEEVRLTEPSRVSWNVSVEELAQLDFDLSPKKRNQSDLEWLLGSLPQDTRIVPLKDCCQVEAGRGIPSHDLIDIPAMDAEGIRPAEEIVADIQRFQAEADLLSDHDPAEEPQKKERLQRIDELAKELDYREYSESYEIPFIRIRDVQRGQVLRGSSWLTRDATLKLEKKWKLKSGDVLLSKSGTIGKVGIVRETAVGGIASSGFFVLRANRDVLDSHYLMAYLQSTECSAWLDDRSRGSAAKHISVNVIKELPVPVPSMRIQQRIGAECRELGTDAVELLVKVMTGTEANRISELINRIWPHFAARHNDVDHGISLSAWSRLANEIQTVRNEVAHGHGDGGDLTRWILMFNETLSPLNGAESIPPGPALMSVFRDALQRAEKAEQSVEGDLPDQRKARLLTHIFARWIERELAELMRHSRIVFTANLTEIIADQPTELTLEIENQGSLPIRNLFVTTEPDWGTGNVTYLAEGARSEIGLLGVAPTDAGKFNLTISWTAVTLNGEPLDGTRDIGFDVVSANETEDASPTEIGGSPYVCGDPVTTARNDVFFGRDDLIAQIRRQIVQSGNVVLLEGNRRAGKSSVLWHLEGATAVPGWLGVYCSLQGTEGDSAGGTPTADVFRGIAYEIVQSVRKLNGSAVLPDGSTLDGDRRLGIARSLRQGISQEAPFQDFREYLELILETLAKQNLGLLLMLDEFDKLQEGIDKGITSPQVPENIRFLVQSFPRFSAILTGSRRLKRMREEYWSALFGLGTRLGVSALTLEAASRLITEPVKGRLSYAKSAVTRAYELTAGQPYLLQCLCNRVFDQAARSGIRSITIDQVSDAAAALVEDNEHFASLWDYTEFDRRRFLLYLLNREENGRDPMRLGVIEAKLEEAGVELREEIIIADLEYLRELELVDLHNESSGAYYTLTIPMMGQWLDSQQDFEVLRSRARAEAEDLNGMMREFIRLHKEIKELEDSAEDDDV